MYNKKQKLKMPHNSFTFEINIELDIKYPANFLKAFYMSLYDADFREDEAFINKTDYKRILIVLDDLIIKSEEKEEGTYNYKKIDYPSFILSQSGVIKNEIESLMTYYIETPEDFVKVNKIIEYITETHNEADYLKFKYFDIKDHALSLWWDWVSEIFDKFISQMWIKDYFDYVEENFIEPKRIKGAVRKIENHFFKSYWSPYTELGQRRFNRELEKLEL
jgi:hypothetical protein